MAARQIPNLTLRAVSACVFVPLVIALIWAGDWALFLLVLVIVVRGAWEFYHITQSVGHRPAKAIGLPLSAGLCGYLFWIGPADLDKALLVVTLLCLLALLCRGVQNYTANALLTLGGVIYLGLLGSAPLLIVQAAGAAHHTEASRLLVVLFLCIWLTDTAAYFGGCLWGQKKLVPRISPGKTVVGFVAGFSGGLLPLLLWGLLPSFTFLELAGLLLLASAGGQAGDLVESAIKRDMGIKDTPPLIPGHGGLLDRFDSYLFAFPLAYLYLNYLAIF